eukprot:g29059.t1
MTIDNFLEGKILTCEDEDDAPGDRQATEEKAITWRIFTPEQAEVAQSRAPIFGQPGSEAVKGWNEEHPQCAIAAGHVVVEANGARTPGQMLEHFRQDKVVYLLINRQPTAQQAQVLRTALAIHQWSQTVDELLEDVVMDVVETCAICQEDLGTSEVKVPCGHHFHRTCIKEWLPRNTSASQRKLYRRSEIEPAPVMNVPMSIEVKACAARGVTMPAPITGGPRRRPMRRRTRGTNSGPVDFRSVAPVPSKAVPYGSSPCQEDLGENLGCASITLYPPSNKHAS